MKPLTDLERRRAKRPLLILEHEPVIGRTYKFTRCIGELKTRTAVCRRFVMVDRWTGDGGGLYEDFVYEFCDTETGECFEMDVEGRGS